MITDLTALVGQVSTIDALPLAGAAAGRELDLLARRFATLRAAGPPPGVDPPSYSGRLYSLELFAVAAADEAAAGLPRAGARYAVVRQETATLLGLVNTALGTSLALPPLPTTPTTSATATR